MTLPGDATGPAILAAAVALTGVLSPLTAERGVDGLREYMTNRLTAAAAPL